MLEETVNPFAGTALERLSPTPWNWQVTQPEWCMDKLIPARSIGMLVGASNSGKSHLACDIVCSMVGGQPMWQEFGIKSGPVVMFSESLGHIQARMKGYVNRRKFRMKHPLYSYPTLSLGHEEIELLGDWMLLLPEPPQMVVFDTMITSFSYEENDNREAGRIIKMLEDYVLPRLSKTGCIMLIHHTSKASEGRTARGASALIGNIDWSVNISWNKDLERTVAQWEKDRWRVVEKTPQWLGEPVRETVNFTNGEQEMMVLDWQEFSEEDRKAHEQLKKEQNDENVREAVIRSMQEAISQRGWIFVKASGNVRPPKGFDPWRPANIDNHRWKKIREWVFDNATGEIVNTDSGIFAGKKIWKIPV